MKKLYESLFILNKCRNSINQTWEHLNAQPKLIETNPDVIFNLMNIINLETNVYFEEFDNFRNTTEPVFHKRMEEVRQIIKPVRKRIKKWSQLEDFRHHFIAHPFRDKHGKFSNPDSHKYNVPRNMLEFYILVNLMNYIHGLVRDEFKEESIQSTLYMTTQIQPPFPERDHSNLNSDHIQMANEVDEICKKLNKTYSLKVMQYIFPDDIPGAEPTDTLIETVKRL